MRFSEVRLGPLQSTSGTLGNSLVLSCSRQAPVNLTDVIRVCWTLRTTQSIAVHMEALNHCFLTRSDLRERLEQKNLLGQVEIPEDGATVAGSARSSSERRHLLYVDANQEKRDSDAGKAMHRTRW